ncbi:hypothetical protein ACVWXM_004685 [Bradyrhizobium sp. GM7.3]
MRPQGETAGIDYTQQALVDFVAVRQHLVEIHRAHHRTDVGHGQHGDGLGQVRDLVARLGGIEHLKEGDAVDRHGGVVLGDHLLLGNVDHLLHHVDLASDAIEIGHDQIEPGAQRLGVFAEPLDGPVIALRHRLHAGHQRDDDEQDQNNRENVETAHISSKAEKIGGKRPFPRCHWSGSRPQGFSKVFSKEFRRIQGSAVVPDFGIGRILHKTPGEGMVAIMYLRGALESVLAHT